MKNKVYKMCLKYLLTFYQTLSSQYQIQIDRSSDVHNVLTIVTNTNVVETRIVSSICTVISSRARPELWPSGKRVAL